MSSLARKTLNAGIALAMLGSAAVALTPATASAQALLARSECINGFWHVMTSDITDPDHWIVPSDEKTEQPCGGTALVLDVLGHVAGELAFADRRHDHGDFGRDMRREDGRSHWSGVEVRSGRE